MAGLILPHRGVTPKIAEDVFVAETAVIIGDVEIGAGSSIWYGAVIRGDVNKIRIGRNTNIQDGTVIHANHDRNGDYRQDGGGDPTHIGDNITIGHLALLHACTLADNAFVGMRAVVMDRAVVESQAMIGAGAVITPGKIVSSGQLWTGTPAKHRRDLSAEEIADLAYSAKHYAKLAGVYLARQRSAG